MDIFKLGIRKRYYFFIFENHLAYRPRGGGDFHYFPKMFFFFKSYLNT